MGGTQAAGTSGDGTAARGRSGAEFVITSATGERLDARHLIVAAGGWRPDLADRLPLNEAAFSALGRVSVRQEQVHHFPLQPWAPRDWPTFIYKDSAMLAYGLPGGRDSSYADAPAGTSAEQNAHHHARTHLGIKVAQFKGGQIIGDAEEQTGRLDEAKQQRMIEFITVSVPGLGFGARAGARALCRDDLPVHLDAG